MKDDHDALVAEASEAARAVGMLGSDQDAFATALRAFREQQADVFHGALERLNLLPWCRFVCGWFCSKDCVLRCFLLAGPPPKSLAEVAEPEEFADLAARITADEGLLGRLVDVVEQRDATGFDAFVEELQIHRFRHVLCHWVCLVRCGLACRRVCDREDVRTDLITELREAGRAIAKLASVPEALSEAIRAARSADCDGVRRIVTRLGLSRQCHYICVWFCAWRCFLVCITLARSFLDESPDVSDDEVFAFAQATGGLAEKAEVLGELLAATEHVDEPAFAALVQQHGLQRFAIQLCHWLCYLHCGRFCLCVCPPLLAEIDAPAEGSCASSVLVSACSGSGTVVAGVEIVGSAAGGGFDHYTLHYSWGANPPVETAVVYPDCSRPPSSTSYSTPVVGGTLGWLDVALLPPGITSFTIYLDVFDAAAGHVSDTATFEIQTKAVEITAVAKVTALEGPDPFHPATSIKLIKSTVDASPLVPEQAIGGSISVDGSAYTVGCSRIMSQFVLVRYDAPPAAPVPNPPDATGGMNLMAAVPYEDVPNHPWQSGCFLSLTPNTILNGDLVAFWATKSCTLPFPHTVAKVSPVPFWGSAPLNGRFLILLEVRDRPLPAGAFPGSFAAKDQVAVWIDNQTPTALITSIGGISGCGDLHLKPFVNTTAEIVGVAWDPPIVPTAPQQQPNDNFGSYSLSYKKNGEAATFAIPGLTPNTRVPNIWPGPLLAGAQDVLAKWDIVAALDYTGPSPTPAGMLARGERCAFVIDLSVTDTTHVGDSGNHNTAGPFTYALTIINDI